MAVKLKDVITEMKAVVAAGDRYEPLARSTKILQLAADFLAVALAGGGNGQTAILMVDADLEQLIFCVS